MYLSQARLSVVVQAMRPLVERSAGRTKATNTCAIDDGGDYDDDDYDDDYFDDDKDDESAPGERRTRRSPS